MSARIYFTPFNGVGTTYKIDVPTGVTLEILDPDERSRQVESSSTADGLTVATWWARSTLELRMTWCRMLSNATKDWHAKITQILDYLDRGDSIGIARDSAKMGLYPLTDNTGATLRGGISDGVTAIWVGDDYLGWETSPTLASADEVVVESDYPEGQRWCSRLSGTAAGPPVTLTAAVANMGDIGAEAWLRVRDCYPYLFRQTQDLGVPALTQEEVGEQFRLSLRLELRLPTVTL